MQTPRLPHSGCRQIFASRPPSPMQIGVMARPICNHRLRTFAAIARAQMLSAPQLHAFARMCTCLLLTCLVQCTCLVYALLLRTLLRTSLRWRVFRGDDAHSSQPARCGKYPTLRLCRINARHGHTRRALFVRPVAPLTRCLHVACAAASPVTAPLDAVPCRCVARHCSPAPQGTVCASSPTPLAAAPLTAARPR